MKSGHPIHDKVDLFSLPISYHSHIMFSKPRAWANSHRRQCREAESPGNLQSWYWSLSHALDSQVVWPFSRAGSYTIMGADNKRYFWIQQGFRGWSQVLTRWSNEMSHRYIRSLCCEAPVPCWVSSNPWWSAPALQTHHIHTSCKRKKILNMTSLIRLEKEKSSKC